ncbi:MAG: hypothetical protein AABY27_03705 [Pseudomonadota bacterium]
MTGENNNKEFKRNIQYFWPTMAVGGLLAYTYLTSPIYRNNEESNKLSYAKFTLSFLYSSFIEALFLTTLVTSIVLKFNPNRTNFHETRDRQAIDLLGKLTPGLIAGLTTGIKFFAKTIGGDRAEGFNSLFTTGAAIAEQAARIGVIKSRLYGHLLARANEDGSMRLIRRKTQATDEAITYSVELIAEALYRVALSGVASHYVPMINDGNKLLYLAYIHGCADLIESAAMRPISNAALALEVIADNEVISKFLHKLGMASDTPVIVVQQDRNIKAISEPKKLAYDVARSAETIEEKIKVLGKYAEDLAVNLQYKFRRFLKNKPAPTNVISAKDSDDDSDDKIVPILTDNKANNSNVAVVTIIHSQDQVPIKKPGFFKRLFGNHKNTSEAHKTNFGFSFFGNHKNTSSASTSSSNDKQEEHKEEKKNDKKANGGANDSLASEAQENKPNEKQQDVFKEQKSHEINFSMKKLYTIDPENTEQELYSQSIQEIKKKLEEQKVTIKTTDTELSEFHPELPESKEDIIQLPTGYNSIGLIAFIGITSVINPFEGVVEAFL